MTTEHPRIVLDPKILAGKPVIRGTRLSVEFIIGLMADGWSEVDILANSPKSLSKVRRMRSSRAAQANTSGSAIPGAAVLTQTTSCPAALRV